MRSNDATHMHHLTEYTGFNFDDGLSGSTIEK